MTTKQKSYLEMSALFFINYCPVKYPDNRLLTPITIRKSINKFQARNIENNIQIAERFIENKYNIKINVTDLYYIFSTYTRSRYFRNPLKSGKYTKPVIQIAVRSKLFLYELKRLNIKNYKINLIDLDVAMICSLIHELTHHAQYELSLKKSELEACKNEIEYLKENHIFYYNLLIN